MDYIRIYTDGGSTGNPGPGGWAAVIIDREKEVKLSGGEAATTNNRMEMTAAIKALEYIDCNIKKIGNIVLSTDSEYLKKGITEWIINWKRNNWKTAAKKEVKNKDLWARLDELNNRIKVEWKWVKGHAGDRYNELCDALVSEERKRFEYFN